MSLFPSGISSRQHFTPSRDVSALLFTVTVSPSSLSWWFCLFRGILARCSFCIFKTVLWIGIRLAFSSWWDRGAWEEGRKERGFLTHRVRGTRRPHDPSRWCWWRVSLLQRCSTFRCFQPCQKLPNCLPNWLYHFHAYRQWLRVCFGLRPHQQLLWLILDFSHPYSAKRYLVVVLTCISLTTRGSEHVVVCLFSICVSPLAGFPGGSDGEESAYNTGDPVKSGCSDRFYFPGLQNHCGRWLQPWN